MCSAATRGFEVCHMHTLRSSVSPDTLRPGNVLSVLMVVLPSQTFQRRLSKASSTLEPRSPPRWTCLVGGVSLAGVEDDGVHVTDLVQLGNASLVAFPGANGSPTPQAALCIYGGCTRGWEPARLREAVPRGKRNQQAGGADDGQDAGEVCNDTCATTVAVQQWPGFT